jgi:pimeloyl-ACP methyl ester carboxylesterase
MRRFVIRSFIVALTVLLVIIGGLIIEFTFHRGRTPKIENDSTSIASLERIKLGGVDQWILIRGWNKSNPIVLFLHGGPGMPAMYLAHAFQRELEKHFVVVHWDRRGAGKSYLSGVEGDLSVRQTLDDTYELTRLLKNRLGKKKIYLVGHSWGTYLGMLAASEHPEYYSAYIGIGQLSASSSRAVEVQRDFLMQKGSDAGDTLLLGNLKSSAPEIKEDDLFRYGGELYGAKSFWPLDRKSVV